MECLLLLFCLFFSITTAHFLRDSKNNSLSSIQDYGTGQSQELNKVGCNCEWRYLKHYEAKGCRPVYEEKPHEKCACPWRFDCSQTNELPADDRVCIYKKHVYPVGSHIPTSNTCESCTCATEYSTQAATIQCTAVECPSLVSPLPEGCHYVYEENKCCPTSVECPANSPQENTYKVPSCEYRGKMYYEGEQIYPEEDPCLICLCNHQWTGVGGNSSCRQHDCMLERDSRKLKQGCIPIYHEKTCCPIDFHCSDDDDSFKLNRAPSFKLEEDEDEMCYFEKRYYPIGHVLDIKHPTNCVTCTCKTPPDFTCIHSSCPPPPNKDYTNCKAVYKPHSCCPDYTCRNEKSHQETDQDEFKENNSMQHLLNKCQESQCSENERCMLTKDCENCSLVAKCEKVSFGCGQKKCPEGCHVIGKYEEDCPICKCDGNGAAYKFQCRVHSCEENCVLSGRDKNGCPVCKCPQGNLEERICLPTECKGSNCTMRLDSLGCATCTCQLPCQECPPECDSDNECGCTCKNSSLAMSYLESIERPASCPTPWCQGLDCRIHDDKDTCPTCSCKTPCTVPVCQKGCKIETDVSDPGRCPGCVCKLSRSERDNTGECPPPTCQGYNCSVITVEGGCQKCLCESPCEESPKCPYHCKLETNVPQGRCRGCVCSFGEHTTDAVEDMELEKREDLEADFIPLPGKEVVPAVDNIFLIHGEALSGEYADRPGYHYEGGHAYPVLGEPLESALYNADEGDYFADEAEEKALDDNTDKGKCTQKNCPEGQKCVLRRLQCIRTPCPTIPVCIEVEPRCPIPMCAIGCMVMKWDDEVCPSCFCGIIRGAEGRVCPRTRCAGRRCYNVIGDDGCPQCKCDSICIPPKCQDGCRVQETPGKCPVCTCSESTLVQPIISASPTAEAYAVKYSTPSYQCPTPHCNGYNCSLIRGADGCQKCVCDSPCAPCPQHCVKTKTYSEGRCPICDCTSGQCPTQTDCYGTNCRQLRDENGCLTCVCDPKCAEPKCDPGCEVLRDVPPGQCPGCLCRVTVVQAVVQRPVQSCPPITCAGKHCAQTKGADGCMVCSCPTFTGDESQVPEDSSDITFSGVVEAVVAEEDETSTLHTTVTVDLDDVDETVTVAATTQCPSPVCSGLRCSMETAENGCEVCKCRYKCPQPKCVGNCYPETNAPSHRCPGCVCPSKPKPPKH